MCEVEQACQDLGWRLVCQRPTINNPSLQLVARILNGHHADAQLVGLGMSPIYMEDALQLAWQSAVETMGDRMVFRGCGSVEWDGRLQSPSH
jgi:hypothetical protein